MSVLIIGSEGSMGMRYQAILHYLQKPFVCTDMIHSFSQVREFAKLSEGIIVCSPTETHIAYLQDLIPLRKPILCEKPISKSVPEVRMIREMAEATQVPIRMMLQYSVLGDRNRIGKSLYNYFRHGNDGLAWDCMQIIGLARGEVTLREDSPIWTCMLNGKRLPLADMDAAYIAYVQNWFQNPEQDLGFLQEFHEKVEQYAKDGTRWRK